MPEASGILTIYAWTPRLRLPVMSLAQILVGLGSLPRRRAVSRPLLLVMTGAGVSSESGLKACIDELALRQDPNPEPVGIVPDAPILVPLQDRRRAAAEARPNPAHMAIARLEREWAGDFLLVTTNVDGLHEAAGSRRVLHLLGCLSEVLCQRCGLVTNDTGRSLTELRCGCCGTIGQHRANILLSGEDPYAMDRARMATDRCTVFVAVGCGGEAPPINLLPGMAASNHLLQGRRGRPPCRMVEVSPVPTGDPAFGEVIAGPTAVELPRWVDGFLRGTPALA